MNLERLRAEFYKLEKLVEPPLGEGLADCLDCHTFCLWRPNYYMVLDVVWAQANPGIKRMLCLSCLEARLGRDLVRGDFKGPSSWS